MARHCTILHDTVDFAAADPAGIARSSPHGGRVDIAPLCHLKPEIADSDLSGLARTHAKLD
jgi:hypothetical protein